LGPMAKKVDKQEAALMGTDLVEREKRRPYETKVRTQMGLISTAIIIPGFIAFIYVGQILRQPRPAILIVVTTVFVALLLMTPIENYIRRKYPNPDLTDNETSS
ncbi:MAG TPA: hypothetical protein VK171_02350, partial [Fimbriimonas sp.]|nr:hypothetical protein [Fimbriimonas sp.]